MSILPFGRPVVLVQEPVPMAQEWAWDFKNLEYKRKGGKMYLVYEDEAIKVWIWKLLVTELRRWSVYSWRYGNDTRDLIGRGYSKGFVDSEIQRMVRGAILNNLSRYVTDLSNFEITFSDRLLSIRFRANTIYNTGVTMSYGF